MAAKHYKDFVLRQSEFIQRKELVRKFVKIVEVGIDSVTIHFIVDQGHYASELSLVGKPAKAGLRHSLDFLAGNFEKNSSNTLTNGARGQT